MKSTDAQLIPMITAFSLLKICGLIIYVEILSQQALVIVLVP